MADLKTVTDSKGRKIVLRVMDPADMLDLIEAAGEAASNSTWVRYAMAVASVAEFDGVPVPMPESKAQIRAFARKMGNEGYEAVVQAVWGLGAPAEEAAATGGAADTPPADPVGNVAKNS